MLLFCPELINQDIIAQKLVSSEINHKFDLVINTNNSPSEITSVRVSRAAINHF